MICLFINLECAVTSVAAAGTDSRLESKPRLDADPEPVRFGLGAGVPCSKHEFAASSPAVSAGAASAAAASSTAFATAAAASAAAAPSSGWRGWRRQRGQRRRHRSATGHRPERRPGDAAAEAALQFPAKTA